MENNKCLPIYIVQFVRLKKIYLHALVPHHSNSLVAERVERGTVPIKLFAWTTAQSLLQGWISANVNYSVLMLWRNWVILVGIQIDQLHTIRVGNESILLFKISEDPVE